MPLHIEVPTLIKIRDGIRVNVSVSVSHAVEYQLPQRELKKDVQALVNSGTLARKLTAEDYVERAPCDTVSFWFIGAQPLTYRVGREITAEDFTRIVRDLNELEYRSRDDRKPSSNKTGAEA